MFEVLAEVVARESKLPADAGKGQGAAAHLAPDRRLGHVQVRCRASNVEQFRQLHGGAHATPRSVLPHARQLVNTQCSPACPSLRTQPGWGQ